MRKGEIGTLLENPVCFLVKSEKICQRVHLKGILKLKNQLNWNFIRHAPWQLFEYSLIFSFKFFIDSQTLELRGLWNRAQNVDNWIECSFTISLFYIIHHCYFAQIYEWILAYGRCTIIGWIKGFCTNVKFSYCCKVSETI